MTIDLDEGERLAKAATARPWAWDFAHPGHLLGSYANQRDAETNHRTIDCVLDGVMDESGNDCNVAASKEDREYIAWACNNAPALIEELKLLRKVAAAARRYHAVVVLSLADEHHDCDCCECELREAISSWRTHVGRS